MSCPPQLDPKKIVIGNLMRARRAVSLAGTCSLLRVVLERDGHEVLEVANGRLGLGIYQERSADLIITDIAMPEMNGLEMMLELTRDFLNVKVIAISGGQESGSALDVAKLLGARQTFQKPFDVEKLLSAVRYDLTH